MATKILFLINYAGNGGSEKYVDDLVRIFTAQGDDCRLCYNVPGALSERLEARGVPAFRLDFGRAAAFASARKLADYCRENGIEVLHAQYPAENVVALLSRRRYPAPKVVFTNHLTLRAGRLWRTINRALTPREHCAIAVCSEGREVLIENGFPPEKVVVIPNGVEPGPEPVKDLSVRAELGVGEGEFMITTLARCVPEKGLGFLLDAVSRLRGMTDSPLRCVICGDGPLLPELKAQAAQLGIEDCVLFAGYRSDGGRILAAADLYVNSSSSEAMSFGLLEAMRAALPLVVTALDTNRELAEGEPACGIAVPYGDVEGFAQAMLRLMEDEGLYCGYSANARRRVLDAYDLNRRAMDVYRAYQ